MLSEIVTLSPINLILLPIIGLLTYIAIFYFRYFNRTNPLPGPIPLPFIGNVLQYPGDAGKWANQLQLIYGDIFEIYLGTTRTICLCRANLVENLMKSQCYLRTPPNDGLDEFGVSNKGIIFNRNYDDWSYHRRFLQKTIMTPKVAKETVESTQVLFQEMEGFWKRLGDDKEIDFAGWISRLSFENMVLLTTTLRINSITNYYNEVNPQDQIVEPEGTLSNSSTYINCAKSFFDGATFNLLTPKILRHSPGIKGTTKYLLSQKNWLTTNLLGIIKARRAQIENSTEKIDTHDILTQFLTINTDKDVTQSIADDKHPGRMSDDDVRANMTEILGGGSVTTPSTICFVVHYLAQYPEVQKRMVQELDNVLGSDRDSQFTLDQLNKLEYTEAVLKEVSRVFPSVPVNFRAISQPDEIAGHKFPANTQILIHMEGIHHHPSDWQDPDVFNPDRWLNISSGSTKRNKNSFLQFGGGARVCPGRSLSLAEIKSVLALLYRKYDVELVDKAAPLKYHYSFNRQCDELKIKIKPRSLKC
ncbi:14056_t:CDS:2 [Funneliformis geosporum]|uniref:6990_t:CDS:1 n=1 Tax=Funneliformis geosporum TaxID=1117311 RepID=A0A9W4SE71_9GLOM|nr:6990_t:CDS:2 [Funneliformis geosporum]CAI2179562.1 14056_t:CDS:2 [Funneliformis geosporum]